MINYLLNFNIVSVIVRLILAMLFGGIIGLERGRKRRAAGFRTYMFVCVGASLTMILGQYLSQMLDTFWSGTYTIDVSRFGAQVINGVGFLGAGTVIVTGKQQVKGLTTAAGLWASACMGLAIGAGFYECVVFAFLLIQIVVRLFSGIETFIIDRSKNMNIYLEFDSLDNIGQIIGKIKSNSVQIYEVEINREEEVRRPSAVFVVRLDMRKLHKERKFHETNQRMNTHQLRTKLLVSLAELECTRVIEEI